MSKRIIVLGAGEPRSAGRPWAERANAINHIKSRGGRIQADNGGRLLVVDDDEDEATLMKRLPAGSKILAPGDDVVAVMGTMEPEERVFAEALQLRFSRDFLKGKQTRKVGSSPEEQELFSYPGSTPPGEE